MADYKRMVSYMYIYENGIKKKNTGYARVEEHSGDCKITLHMQLPGLPDSIFPTYLIQRKSKNLELVYLGDAILKNQVMESKLHTSSSNVMDSGYDMSDMGGILLFLDENTFFATEWDDKPIILQEIMDALKPAGKRDNEVQLPLYKLPRGWKIRERLDAGHAGTASNPWDLVKRYRQSQRDNNGQVDEADKDRQEVTPEVLPEEYPDVRPESIISRQEKGQKEDNTQAETRPDIASFFDKYPRIYPFEDNEIVHCVKIEPKDIGGLPVDAWVLSSNSFLLHGFYCYRHLIFAKLKDGFGTRYILGVPGIYHNRERIMARMFGFSDFKSVKRSKLKQGDFGYWYMPIQVQN